MQADHCCHAEKAPPAQETWVPETGTQLGAGTLPLPNLKSVPHVQRSAARQLPAASGSGHPVAIQQAMPMFRGSQFQSHAHPSSRACPIQPHPPWPACSINSNLDV